MAEKKMTKKEMFAMVAEVVAQMECEGKAEMLAFLSHEVELLERKSSSPKKSAVQVEQEQAQVKLLEFLAEVGKPVTISELWELVPASKEFSCQKASAMLKKLVEAGKVVKEVDKKKSYFSLAE